MRRRVWVLMKMANKLHPIWARYSVVSKGSWQGYAKEPDTSYCEFTWIAESEDKALLEQMCKLAKET